MSELLEKIELCIEFGKINNAAVYPPNMRGQDGADELTKIALEEGISPSDVLNKALIPGMDKVGQKFSENKIFVPQMLMAAKAMSAAMKHIQPFFLSGAVKQKGTFIIGTVAGDLHDIGKNLVAMMIEGSGWKDRRNVSGRVDGVRHRSLHVCTRRVRPALQQTSLRSSPYRHS